MSIFDDLKAKADVNSDGKIGLGDLEELKDKIPEEKMAELKQKADVNGDGKLNLDDVKDVDFGDVKDVAGDALGDIKDSFL